MPSMFDPITALMTPEMFTSVGQRLGIPGEMVQKGVDIAIPLLTRGVATVAETPEGQVAIAEAVKNADPALLGNLSGHLSNFTPEGGADVLNRLFGSEGRVVTGAIKDATGFDISPLLGMAGPLLLGFLNSYSTKEGLDTSGLVKKLKSEARSFDRQKNDAAVLVDGVLEKVDEVRKLKGSFSAADWAAARNGPLAAAAIIIAAAPSGAKKTADEVAAAIASITESTKDAGTTSLMAALFADGTSGITTEGISDPKGAVKQAVELVSQHAPAEVAAYKKVLMNAATAAANAASEGGFLGMGSKTVNAEEQGALDTLAAMLGI